MFNGIERVDQDKFFTAALDKHGLWGHPRKLQAKVQNYSKEDNLHKESHQQLEYGVGNTRPVCLVHLGQR